jgi:hypothetical protein
VYSHELDAMIGIATQSFQGMGKFTVQDMAKLVEVWVQQQDHNSSTSEVYKSQL